MAAIPIASVVSGKSWLDWIKDHKRLAAWIGIIMSFLLAGLMVVFSAPKWLVFLPVIVAVVLRVMEVERYIRDVDIDAARSKEIGELFHEGRISEAERDQYLEQEGVRRRERNQNVWVAFSIVILFLGVIVHEMLVNNKDLADVLREEAVYLIGLVAFGVFAVTMRPVYRLFRKKLNPKTRAVEAAAARGEITDDQKEIRLKELS